MIRTATPVLVALGLGLVAQMATANPTPPDLVLLNGKIFTSDAAQPHVEAVAIRGERIVAVGDGPSLRALAGPATRFIDLGGRTVIPGIDDAHVHFDVLPKDAIEVDFGNHNPTWSEVSQDLAVAVARAPKGSILWGYVGRAIFYGTEATRGSLDAIAPNHSAILVTLTGHAAILNSAALARVGIREDRPDPLGGRYERGGDGRLTGTLREYAVHSLFRALAASTSDEDAVAQLGSTLKRAAKLGVTSIQNMNDLMTPERCVTLLKRIPTPIRVRVMRMPGTTTTGRDTQEGVSVPKHPASRITVSGTKWWTDGTPFEGSFAPRLGPIDGSDHWENLAPLFPPKELEAMLRETLKSGDQLMLHVSGYASAAAILDAMERMGGAKVWATRRVRFEHGDRLLADLIPRAKQLGVVVIQNPTHLDSSSGDRRIFTAERLSKAQPLGSLIAAGIPVALGSDGDIGPFRDIRLATAHPNRPSEALTREQAVIASTLTSAYAEFADEDKGSLVAGKLADLAVLSQDIFSVPAADLAKMESVLTIVGGEIVYDANVLASPPR